MCCQKSTPNSENDKCGVVSWNSLQNFKVWSYTHTQVHVKLHRNDVRIWLVGIMKQLWEERMPWKEEEFRSKSEGGHRVIGLRNRRKKRMHALPLSSFVAMSYSRSRVLPLRLRVLGFATFAFVPNSKFNFRLFAVSSSTLFSGWVCLASAGREWNLHFFGGSWNAL